MASMGLLGIRDTIGARLPPSARPPKRPEEPRRHGCRHPGARPRQRDPSSTTRPAAPSAPRSRSRSPSWAAPRIDLPHTIAGKRVMGTGKKIEVRQPHAHRKVLGTMRNATVGDAQAAVDAAKAAAPAGARCPSTTGRRSCSRRPSCSPDRGAPTSTPRRCSASRKTAYQAEIDAACELIDFWRINVHFARQILAAAAAAQRQGHLEPHRPPPARGLRLRDHAVQLHRHRRQPADRPGPHGQHRRLEAEPDPAVRRAADDGAARGGRHAARRHQHGHRRRPQRLQGRARRPRPRRHPLHRLDADVPAPLAARSAPTCRSYRTYPRLVGETGGKDFILAHPSRRPGCAAHGHDPRRVRVPGPEVLGRLARLRAALAVEADQGRPRRRSPTA